MPYMWRGKTHLVYMEEVGMAEITDLWSDSNLLPSIIKVHFFCLRFFFYYKIIVFIDSHSQLCKQKKYYDTVSIHVALKRGKTRYFLVPISVRALYTWWCLSMFLLLCWVADLSLLLEEKVNEPAWCSFLFSSLLMIRKLVQGKGERAGGVGAAINRPIYATFQDLHPHTFEWQEAQTFLPWIQSTVRAHKYQQRQRKTSMVAPHHNLVEVFHSRICNH